MNKWGRWTLASVCISYILPTSSFTVSIFAFFLLCVVCVFQSGYFNDFRKTMWMFLLIGSIPVIVLHGILEVKDFIMMLCCIGGISFLCYKFNFTPRQIILFLFCVILPIGLFHLVTDGRVNWNPANGYLNIIGGPTTKHGTAIFGLLLLMAVVTYYFNREKGIKVPFKKKTLQALFVFSLFLITFSSRSVLLAALAFLAYLFVNRNRFRPKLSIVLFVVCNISVFFLEYLADYADVIKRVDWLANLVRVENFDTRHGVTSGRSWLWGVHINAWLDSPYMMGGGRAVTDFKVNDWLPWLGEVANAGSESPFTGFIACYGWVGIGIIIMFIGFFLYAVLQRNLMASAIMFCMIYNTTMGVSFMSARDYSSIFCYFLFFTCLRKKYIYKCK